MHRRLVQGVTSCLSLIREKTNFKEITTLSYLRLLPPNPGVPSRERRIIVSAVRSIDRCHGAGKTTDSVTILAELLDGNELVNAEK